MSYCTVLYCTVLIVHVEIDDREQTLLVVRIEIQNTKANMSMLLGDERRDILFLSASIGSHPRSLVCGRALFIVKVLNVAIDWSNDAQCTRFIRFIRAT